MKKTELWKGMVMNMNKEYNKIKLLREEKNSTTPPSCFDDAICTLAHAMEREYKLIYSVRWRFEGKYFVNRMSYSEESKNDLYKKHYEKILDVQGFSVRILDEKQFWYDSHQIFTKYKYVIALIDGYELPWDAYYQKNHNSHAIIIREIDYNQNVLICCDPWHGLEKVNLMTEQLKKGIQKFYVPLISKVETSQEPYLSLFYQSIGNVDTNMFGEIKEMANTLTIDSDFDWLFKKINEVGWDRWTYGIYLKSMKDINLQLFQYGLEMQDISKKWNDIKLLLIKCGILCTTKSKRLDSLLDYIKRVIYDVAEIEYSLYKQMISMETVVCAKEGKLPIEVKNSKLININIEYLFDNMGMSRERTMEDNADFTGTGEYFVIEGYNDNIKIGEGNDNIICNGQKIDLENCYMNNLVIIGCCEWGNYSDYLVLFDENDVPHKTLLRLSDWSEGPKAGEKIYVSGYSCKHKAQEINKNNKAYIYSVEIPIASHVKTIVLPKCSNMHIMAIQYN